MPFTVEVVPEKAVVVRRGKTVVAASWFGPGVLRPYIYPLLGPGDREATRLGHPEDPVGHSHHRSVWIGHHSVNGADFWGESPQAGRIEQRKAALERAEGAVVSFSLDLVWRTAEGKALLEERRSLSFEDLPGGELALDIDTVLRPAGAAGAPGAESEAVVLGDTPFGLLGIRVARTMRPAEGLGGKLINSNEAEGEKECFWQHAVWVDCSGPVPLAGGPDPGTPSSGGAGAKPAPPGTLPAPEIGPGRGGAGAKPPPGTLPAADLGIVCFDHDDNTVEDTIWHVRDDGWMGPCISKGAPRTIPPSGSLRARYRLEVHAGGPLAARVADRYRAWRRKLRG
jgi:hypothetical protein